MVKPLDIEYDVSHLELERVIVLCVIQFWILQESEISLVLCGYDLKR